MSIDQHEPATVGEREGLWVWNVASGRVHFSPRWTAIIGCEEHEIGTSPEEWLGRVHPEDQGGLRDEIDRRLLEGDGFHVQHRLRHQDGTYRWTDCRGVVVRDDAGAAVRLIGSHADVTGQHAADPLTGLPNRVRFLDRLTSAMERARRHPDFLYAVLLVEIPSAAAEAASASDGHPWLTAAARRLETCLQAREETPRPEARYLIARMGGGPFAILLEGLAHVHEAEVLAERVLASLLVPFPLHGRQVFLQPSVGVAVSTTGYDRSERVLADADAALHRAASLGGNRWEAFDTTAFESSRAHFQLTVDLEGALDRRELRLVYQPILSLASNRIVGLEALLRWNHPTRGVISPLEFIPTAERTGLIVAIGFWVMREACLQVKAWRETLPAARDLWVSVNVSSLQLQQPDLVEQTAEMLRGMGLPPACLMLELTESLAMADPAAVRGLLIRLRVMGVRIGLDDFGTGHSSFAYLHQFPVDFVKIDRSFLVGMEVRPDKTAIISTLTDLAAQLGLHLIAEGIETEEQLAVIRSLGCECGQGFLFSRPIDSAVASDLLRNACARDDTDGAARPPEPLPLAPPQARRGPRLRPLAVAAGAVLLVATSVVALLGGTTPPPDLPPSPLVVVSVLPPATPPVDPDVGAPPATPAPVKLSFPLVHLHAIGSCRGHLTVSASGVSFLPEKGEHAFTLRRGQFLSDLTDDKLTIRTGDRVYRFKAADAAGKDENLSRLRKVLASLDRTQQK